MATESTVPTFVLKFTHLSDEGISYKEQTKEALARDFWSKTNSRTRRPLRGGLSPQEFPAFPRHEGEQRVRHFFGMALLRQLRSYLSVDQDQLVGVFFVVKSIDYGSMELSVAVEGLDKLAKCFDDNFSLFYAVLTPYAADALSDIVGGEFVCELTDYGALAQGFGKASGASEPVASEVESTRRAQRLSWAWIVSNTSLILPVLAALWLFYQAKGVSEGERSSLEKRSSELSGRE